MDNNHQQERQDDPNNQEQEQQELVTHNGASTSRMEYAPGYRFCPTDEELIKYYLRPKIDSLPLPYDGIPMIDLSIHSPEALKREYEWNNLFKEKEMFVFTSRSRKYPKGSRPNRAVAKGFWKPTGVEKCITDSNGVSVIGYRKQLDYLEGNSKHSKRTSWKMHEYRIDQTGPAPNMNANGEMDKQLDKCVLCKIYSSARKKGDGEAEEAAESITNGDESSQTVEETNETFVQDQRNYLVYPGTSIASVFACSSTCEPSSIVQMSGDNTSFIDRQQMGNSVINVNDHGQVTSTSHAFAWPVTYNFATSSSQMFDQKGSFNNQSSPKHDGNSKMNGNNHGHVVLTNEAVMQDQDNNLVSSTISTSQAFAWPMTYNLTSSSQMFDQNVSFINQSSRKRVRNSNMNGNNHGQMAVVQNLVSPVPSTSHVFGWPVSYNTTSDQNSRSFHDQSPQILDRNGSSINNQSSWTRSRYEQEDVGDSSMNANNHGQSTVQNIDGVVQNQNNNLVSMDPSTHAFAWPMTCKPNSSPQKTDFIGQSLPNSFQMYNQVNSLMDLSSCFNHNLFPAIGNFPPMTSAAHPEPNYHQITEASNFSDPCTYMKPIELGDNDEVDSFDAVKDSQTTLH